MGNVVEIITKPIETVVEAVAKPVEDLGKEVEKGVQNVGKEIEKGVQNLGNEVEKGVQNIGKETEKGVQNIGKELEIFGQNLKNNFEKGVSDVGKEAERANENLTEAITVSWEFVENQVDGMGKNLSNVQKRIREGKIVDAIWHIATEQLQNTEENFGTAVMESSLLNNVATSLATIYGGPGGAAAYAAWYTYKQTKDLNFALKAGIITGVTSLGLNYTNGMQSETVGELMKKTLASSSIGAAAIAASGGSEKDIIDAFVKGAAMTLARDSYSSLTKEEIEGRAPTEKAVPKLDTEKMKLYGFINDGESTDGVTAKMPKSISHVGLATKALKGSILEETSGVMQGIAKVPYFNDMAYFHDQWMDVANITNKGLVVTTILPAYLLTVAGGELPIISQTISTNTKGKKKKKKTH